MLTVSSEMPGLFVFGTDAQREFIEATLRARASQWAGNSSNDAGSEEGGGPMGTAASPAPEVK